ILLQERAAFTRPCCSLLATRRREYRIVSMSYRHQSERKKSNQPNKSNQRYNRQTAPKCQCQPVHLWPPFNLYSTSGRSELQLVWGIHTAIEDLDPAGIQYPNALRSGNLGL